MKATPMVHCQILGPLTQLSTVINTLYDENICHVEPHKGTSLEIGQPLAKAEEIAQLLIKITAVLAVYPAKAIPLPNLTPARYQATKRAITQLYETFQNLQEQKPKLREQKTSQKHHNILTALLEKCEVTLENLKLSTRITPYFGLLTKNLPELDRSVMLKRQDNYILALGPKESLAPLEPACTKLTLEYQLSSTVDQDIAQIKKDSTKIKKDTPKLATLQQQLKEELKKQELPLQFAVTERTFIANGWIPAADEHKLGALLQKNTSNTIDYYCTQPKPKQRPPTKFNHKKLVNPFSFLLKLYDIPQYKEIDPTSLLLITFPLFFGFMLGDVGYGLVLLLGFWLLKRKLPQAAQLLKVMMFAATSSIFFGILYGEYFGFEHIAVNQGKALCDTIGICLPQHTLISHGVETVVADFPRLLGRAHSSINVFGYDVLSVLVIGAIFGIIHINFGLLLGAINETQQHGFRHALEAKVSWMILQLGAALAILPSVTQTPTYFLWLGILVSLSGIVLLIKGEGMIGIIEIPALLSNILSYMRLGAVGLASVGLAVVVNENLAAPLFSKGPIGIIAGITIMILGHGINILLGVIGPFLHSIRLHYVEFFSKFFHGGGLPYKPFGKKDMTT